MTNHCLTSLNDIHVLATLSRGKLLDLRQAYQQLPLAEESKKYNGHKYNQGIV